MATKQVSFTSPYVADLRNIERRRAMAQALTQQAVSPTQTQMVSGHAVPTGGIEGISRIAQALLARSGMKKADEQEREVYDKQRAAQQEAFGQISQAKTPQEAAQIAISRSGELGIDPSVGFDAWIKSTLPQKDDQKSLLQVDTDNGTSLRNPLTGEEVALVPKTVGTKDALSYQDLGDRVGIFKNGVKIGEEPKGVDPGKAKEGKPTTLDGGSEWLVLSPDGQTILNRFPKSVSPDIAATLAARQAESQAQASATEKRDAVQFERDVKLKRLEHELNMEKFGAESKEARESAAALAQSQKELELFRQQGQQALQANQQAFTAEENEKGRTADAAKQDRQFAFQANEGNLSRQAQLQQNADQLALRREELSQRMAELDKQIAASAAQGEAGREATARLQQERLAAEAEQKDLDRQFTAGENDLSRTATRDNQLQQQAAEMARLQQQIEAAAARGQEDREAQVRLQQLRQEYEGLQGEKNREFQAQQAVAERQGRAALQDDQQAFTAGESELDRRFRESQAKQAPDKIFNMDLGNEVVLFNAATKEAIGRFPKVRDQANANEYQVKAGGKVYVYREGQQEPLRVLDDPNDGKAPDVNKPFLVGPNGEPVANKAFQDYELQRAREGSTKVNQSVNTKAQEAFDVETAKSDSAQLSDLKKAADSSRSILATVRNLRDAIKAGVYSGGGAKEKTAAASLISGLTGYTPRELPGTEIFNSEASRLVLDRLRALGANPTEGEREFLVRTMPNIQSSPQARDALIKFVEQKAQEAISTWQRADAYARKNKTLGGFDWGDTGAPTAPEPATPGKGSTGGWSIKKVP